jgi:hypothetical protein
MAAKGRYEKQDDTISLTPHRWVFMHVMLHMLIPNNVSYFLNSYYPSNPRDGRMVH